jgi:hypothetical protein
VTVNPSSGGGLLPTSGLVLQLDADNGVTTTNGNVVTAWADQSGFGNHLTGSGDPNLLTGALNGHNVIQFDTNGDKLERILATLNGLPAGDSDRSVFMVAKYNEVGYGGFTYGKTTTNQAFGLNVDAEGELMVQGWGSADMLTTVPGTGQGWLTQSAIVSRNPSGSSNEIINHYKNGASIDTKERNFNTILEKLVIGSNFKGTNSIDMEVATILVYDRALTEVERQQVEAYLQQKYGFSNTSTNTPPTATSNNLTVEAIGSQSFVYSVSEPIYSDRAKLRTKQNSVVTSRNTTPTSVNNDNKLERILTSLHDLSSNNQAFGLNVDAEDEPLVNAWSTADGIVIVPGTGERWLIQSDIISRNHL